MPDIGTPEWWVDRLYVELSTRQPALAKFDAYYRGDHPLPWLPTQAQAEFRRILRMTRTNYMGLVVDAKAERIAVEGFRVGDSDSTDGELWRIWQANDLDSDSSQAIIEALIGGRSYLLVAPNSDDPSTPIITVEHPSQTIVAYEPGSNRRKAIAALKVWLDDWTGATLATLFLRGAIYKLMSTETRPANRSIVASPTGDYSMTAALPLWRPRLITGEDPEATNPLGVIPFVELANDPRLLTGGRSELYDVTDIQDRINKTVADRLITQDFGAFPQKWATGFPETDADGNPQKVEIGRDRLVKTDVAETKFGQWDAAPLDPYSMAKREDVKDIASRTRTPAQYLLGEMSNVNGETLKASESGLVAAVRSRSRHYAEGIERAMRLAQLAAGKTPDTSMETLFRNPEFRTEGETVDALVKMATLGVPNEALWERWGASPKERDRWKAMAAEGDAFGRLTSLLEDQAAPQL